MGWRDGKVCIVTGGAGSLGLASAKLLHQEGAAVMLVDLHEADLRKAASEIGDDRVAYAVADASQTEAVRRYIDATMTRWGRIDVIFSNAGNHGDHKPIAEYPEDNFDAVWAVHVKGAFLAAKHGLPHMGKSGSFIITSSVVGVRGMPGAYALSPPSMHKSAGCTASPERLADAASASTRCIPGRSTISTNWMSNAISAR